MHGLDIIIWKYETGPNLVTIYKMMLLKTRDQRHASAGNTKKLFWIKEDYRAKQVGIMHTPECFGYKGHY